MMKHERNGDRQRLIQQRAREEERAEMDAAYQRGLEEDQRKDAEEAARKSEEEKRKRREREAAEEARQREEEAARKREEAERAEEERRRERKRKRLELSDEPEAGAPGVTRLRIRLPDGTVIERRFRLSATCAEVFLWLEGCEELARLRGAWSLILRPATVEGGLLPTDETLEELNLRGVTLLVQDDTVRESDSSMHARRARKTSVVLQHKYIGGLVYLARYLMCMYQSSL
jgi:flagellar biosynthesis GTPase FlhF